MKELCKNWPEAEELVKDLRKVLEDYSDSLVEMSVNKLFDEVDSVIGQVRDEHAEETAGSVPEDAVNPISSEGEHENQDLNDLHAVAEHAKDLVEYLDGDRPEINVDDLRFRLRRMGFSVNATTPVVLGKAS